MGQAKRTLSPAVIEALTYWPGIVHAVAPAPVDLGVLLPWFNELLGQWPWWDRAWRVTHVEPARYPDAPPSSDDSQWMVMPLDVGIDHVSMNLSRGERGPPATELVLDLAEQYVLTICDPWGDAIARPRG